VFVNNTAEFDNRFESLLNRHFLVLYLSSPKLIRNGSDIVAQ